MKVDQLDFTKAKMSTAIFVRRYPADDTLRRHQFEFEDAFAKEIGHVGPAQVFNIPPNAPQNYPWFMLTDGKKRLTVSSVAMQLDLQFEGTARPQSLRDMLGNQARLLDYGSDKIFSAQNQAYAIVDLGFNLSYPLGAEDEYAEMLADYALKAKLPDTPFGIGVTLGTRTDEFENLITMGQYKRRTVVQQGIPGMPTVPYADMDFSSVEEEGLQVKIVISNRPRRGGPFQGMFQNLLPQFSPAAVGAIDKMAARLIASFS